MTKSEARRLQRMSLEEVRALAAKVLQAEKRSRATRRERSAPRRAPGKTKAERNAERDARWEKIKSDTGARCIEEAGGRCEFCRERAAVDPHHIIGAGDRRKMERMDTVAWVCRPCHDAWDGAWAHAEPVLHWAAEWAATRGYWTAHAAIERRMHLARAKAQHPGARAGRGGPEAP